MDVIPTAQEDEKMRPCGPCALCCKVLPIDESETLNKPGGVWCRHWTKKGGCGVYAERDPICRGFNCLWKSGHLPEHLSPHKTKCVLSMRAEGVLIVTVDPLNRGAWAEGDMGAFLSCWPEKFVVQWGEERFWVPPNSSLPIKKWLMIPFRKKEV